MDPGQQLRNLRDFLLVYNRMTEVCFNRCSSNFNYRNLTMDEERCLDSCAGKLIRSNHRLMGTYVQLMPKMVQRRMEEMESKASQVAMATEPATSVDVAPLATESAVDLQSPVTPPTQLPVALTPSVNDVSPEVFGSLVTPAGPDTPLDPRPQVSNSTTTSEVNIPAVTVPQNGPEV
ncbi:mitochondrial import inner membrane translocase subunit Tim10 B [Antennarius striatus]|uniref:mitochondrial import inner membrane translocase subunit Tim10 B n=1 Tax=Antennarius striatus TaxID=241820 RepID=UPI0035AD8895